MDVTLSDINLVISLQDAIDVIMLNTKSLRYGMTCTVDPAASDQCLGSARHDGVWIAMSHQALMMHRAQVSCLYRFGAIIDLACLHDV